ncbi:hypothetical protein BU23DRAFT_465631 [Bimuria novae-zelandiae CBS 107.79]|uniref:BTB domain-containing protein n=1 Tax=Bimuria novae-zelandiae CBS 107.79 TaxID=1447943 RepID=A0A6A5VA15_9PLEO|nr:hypothetical protein BU23DRAFT_465631 [Bimuria novae-zelandiae CBS 107.79]
MQRKHNLGYVRAILSILWQHFTDQTNSIVVRNPEYVTVIVGPERAKYQILKPLFVEQSEYFARALNGEWLEAQEQTVVLVDVEPGICTYNGCAVLFAIDNAASQPFQTASLIVVKAVCLAERLQAPGFKKASHNGYVSLYMKKTPYYSSVIYASQNLPKADPIIDFMVDLQSYNWLTDFDTEREIELREQLPMSFLNHVMTKIVEVRVDKKKE